MSQYDLFFDDYERYVTSRKQTIESDLDAIDIGEAGAGYSAIAGGCVTRAQGTTAVAGGCIVPRSVAGGCIGPAAYAPLEWWGAGII